ncbi:MAG: hypothetical protein WA055_00400 [Candidatus Moraniibacteriota bacterium]
MKKIISRIFIKMVAVSMIFLNFKKDVVAQLLDDPGVPSPGVALPPPSYLDILDLINSIILIILAPLSLLLTIIFYVRYFLIRKKIDDISKIKTKKALKKAKIFLIISILLITLYIILKMINNYIMNHSELWY